MAKTDKNSAPQPEKEPKQEVVETPVENKAEKPVEKNEETRKSEETGKIESSKEPQKEAPKRVKGSRKYTEKKEEPSQDEGGDSAIIKARKGEILMIAKECVHHNKDVHDRGEIFSCDKPSAETLHESGAAVPADSEEGSFLAMTIRREKAALNKALKTPMERPKDFGENVVYQKRNVSVTAKEG